MLIFHFESLVLAFQLKLPYLFFQVLECEQKNDYIFFHFRQKLFLSHHNLHLLFLKKHIIQIKKRDIYLVEHYSFELFLSLLFQKA